MTHPHHPHHGSCPDCADLSRRDFMKTTAAGVAAASVIPGLVPGASAAPKPDSKSETLVAQLYKSFNDEQRKALCFPFDHELRLKVDNNWFITEQKIGSFLTADQQAMVKDIFMNLHSEQYRETVYKQVEHDGGRDGGFSQSCAVALFGEPGTGKFQFVLTGRHCTRRCDGDSVEGAAFGGPIFYGHAAKSFNEDPTHEGNAYWFQAKRANEAFQALSGTQREKALITGEVKRERGVETVKLAGKTDGLPGIPIADLTGDQKELYKKVMADLLMPFRKEDADEAMKLVTADGGFDKLHVAYYTQADIGNDKVWDVWQIEGPNMIWYFRGAPHVHVWVNIRDKA